MKIVAKTVSVITAIVTAAVILICAAFVLPRAIGLKPYIVRSGSMEPDIPTGSIIFVDTHNQIPKVGEVFTFEEPDGVLVTHRIVHDNGDGTYTTKGDANSECDANPISKNQIIGKYKVNAPGMGYFFAAITGRTVNIAGHQIPGGPILIILALITLNLLSTFLNDLAETDEDVEADNYTWS